MTVRPDEHGMVPWRGAGGDNKRVSNRRILAEVRVGLAHPTYREGLAASVLAGMHGDRG